MYACTELHITHKVVSGIMHAEPGVCCTTKGRGPNKLEQGEAYNVLQDALMVLQVPKNM